MSDLCALLLELVKYTVINPNVFPYCYTSLELLHLHVYVLDPAVAVCGEFGMYVLVMVALERCAELQFPFR